jgi:hypothetical protein
MEIGYTLIRKNIMKHLIRVILIAAFCVGVVSAQEKQSLINPASIYHQDAVTVVSPNQAGWVLETV